MKKNKLSIIAALAGIALFSLPTGNAIAAIDGGYVGTGTCQPCHTGEHAEFIESGHPYKFRQTNGADCGAGACDAISNLLPTPLTSNISTLTNDALILDDGSGNLDWSVIQYIIGGYGWKARYGILDATDADGDVIDDTGYVWTGGVVQYNVLTDTWSAYHGGEDKSYSCGTCHNTNGTTDLLASRTEPWATIPGAGVGFTSQWTFDGVQCEACHGPGEAHAAAPGPGTYPVDTTKAMCGTCHHRSGADDHGADTKGGYIRHHEQYNEQVGNTLEPGVHASLECITCHDPHKRSHTIPDSVATALGITDNDETAEERAAVTSCAGCHTKSVRYHSDIQCIDCHMPGASKSATAETGTYGKSGDVKTHIFKINPDPLAEDTAASPNSVTGTNVAHNYVTLNYACGQCHDSSMSTYVGVPLTMAELGDYANEMHTSPVNQNIGFEDTVFNNLTEADCRICHSSGIPDRHHMLYGSTMPQGICSATSGTCQPAGGEECADDSACATPGDTCVVEDRECFDDADCVLGINICSNTGDPCVVAEDCPKQYQHPTCGNTPYCAGTSAAQNNPNDGVYGCLSCHDEDTTGGVTNFVVYRDCTTCHVQLPNSPSVHHLDEGVTGAKAGNCVACHGDVVDDPLGCMDTQCVATGAPCVYDSECDAVTPDDVCEPVGPGACDDGHEIPTYAPSLVTPDVSHDPAEVGNCNFCHDAGTDSASGVEVVDNHDTHHGTGVYKNRYGGTFDSAICEWCHKSGNPHAPGGHDADRIRNCENCHGMESLHNIQADSNGGGIVVGGELAGYGHIGIDDPAGDSDCFGCHGFAIASEGITGSGVPSIDTVAPLSMTAGAATQVTITGAALTTAVPEASADIRLTAADGSTVTIVPDSISEGALTVTINAAAGTYSLQALKDGEASNAVGISVLPAVAISDIDCSKCLGVMTITGQNFAEMPEGILDINVTEGGAELDIIEWTDTMIKAAGARCRGEVTVNSVYGSSQ